MSANRPGTVLLCWTALAMFDAMVPPAAAPQAPPRETGAATGSRHSGNPAHPMWAQQLGRGWVLTGMAQAYPLITAGAPGQRGSPLAATEAYLTQPVAMLNLEGPASRLVLRATLDFEGLTQPGGELTFGAWGEGFLDSRHPHTLLHEAMLSLNLWDVAGGAFSVSAGKGFAPYGTDDPMSRPGIKYPTNHHLSQILERWTVNAVYLNGTWSAEAGVFAGAEPEGPYDFGNLRGFPDSWSVRLARRFGPGAGPFAAWEASLSAASVREEHRGHAQRTALYATSLRHSGRASVGRVYALAEASWSRRSEGDGFHSLLGEAVLERAGHAPFLRLEYATRPEFDRQGPAGTAGFFRYDHDAEPAGATRWLIATAGYERAWRGYPAGVRPFVAVQFHRVWPERGGIDPAALFGTDRFWSLSAGLRVFFGGEPMRMGAYGVLDPITAMRAPAAEHGGMEHGGH